MSDMHKRVKRYHASHGLTNPCDDCGADFVYDEAKGTWYCPNDPERKLLNKEIGGK